MKTLGLVRGPMTSNKQLIQLVAGKSIQFKIWCSLPRSGQLPAVRGFSSPAAPPSPTLLVLAVASTQRPLGPTAT